MKQRILGRTGQSVSQIGFGAWAIGGTWGEVSIQDAEAALHAALDAGITFIDTADVYGDGRSEKIIAKVLNERGGERPYVATKLGRRLSPHVAQGYTAKNLNEFIDRSLENLQTDSLDLVQLHCPPTEIYYTPEVFSVMDDMVAAGKIRHYGVSVEKVEEGLKALEFANVSSIQLIYNIFRQRPAELLLHEAKRRDVGIIARVPLASGLLTGKMRADTAFSADDHRAFNRNGEAFDKGETFSGVPYDVALDAVEDIRRFVTGDVTMAMFALRWILMNENVTVVIPGSKSKAQSEANARASEIAALSDETMIALKSIYQEKIAPWVHQRW
ncbi:aldo/keto reductase [Rouxiella silvae]|uniref:Aldo/keto reductase n=1 Tax=Rouxiella silvae TaxID=1646373 RepID=A0AA41BWI3_9GAMM|nr:aldo/keto reductase [Rouxiella silvae]KQN46946.1 aldo/keto reductase [Serratia sp. Leaf50]MBF6636553.1 aldo/keto reductase [Rouxiella silvae]ORJ20483.1 aldo/keto reductase [Rouxiella silvae]